jgi:hypothetical protein
VLHRLIPTTPWEAIWYGIGQWFDVADDQMGTVLPNLGSWNVGQTLFTSGMLYAGDDMVAAPVPEPEPMPSSTDLTTGTLNGQCLGIWRLITPAGQSVPIPTCVIPDPSVLPAGVTTFISLAGDIVTIGSPNTPTYNTFVSDFATDMAATLGLANSSQIVVNGIAAGSITVDFTVLPTVDQTTGTVTPISIDTITTAFAAPGVSLAGTTTTAAIPPETVVMYAANCPAATLAQITSTLPSCCDAATNGAVCERSVPSSCSSACNAAMVPYWRNCGPTILQLTAPAAANHSILFDRTEMEKLLNGMCADGHGALTPPPPPLVAPSPPPPPSGGATVSSPAEGADNNVDTITIALCVFGAVVVIYGYLRCRKNKGEGDDDNKGKDSSDGEHSGSDGENFDNPVTD